MSDSTSKPRLLDQVREKIRLKHYSIRTEQAYTDWVRRFVLFHGKRHPDTLGGDAIEAFLTHLAVEGNVAASTQNQALSALLFLYRDVLAKPLPMITNVEPAKKPARLPVVLTVTEVRAVLARMDGRHRMMAWLLYGAGLRLMECVRLRIKDIDFEYRQITVRDGKGQKDRVTMLPTTVAEMLKAHLMSVRIIHEQDLAEGFGEVYLPHALDRKYPTAPRELGWQYVFPADQRSQDPRSDKQRRHHIGEQTLQRAVRVAVRAAGILKPASCHTFRHNAESRIMPNAA